MAQTISCKIIISNITLISKFKSQTLMLYYCSINSHPSTDAIKQTFHLEMKKDIIYNSMFGVHHSQLKPSCIEQVSSESLEHEPCQNSGAEGAGDDTQPKTLTYQAYELWKHLSVHCYETYHSADYFTMEHTIGMFMCLPFLTTPMNKR